MPAKYDKLGISFQYPENWTLDEADALAGRNSVTVYSPGGAFWSVAVHPRSADAEKLARGVVNLMKEEYEELEAEEASETVGGQAATGFDMNFYYLDFTNSAQVRMLKTDRATYTVFCQGEDREFDRLQPVFRAMTASLLGTLAK
jgi:hypothetical protein